MSEERAFPVFVRLAGRVVLVVGGGHVALDKAQALHAAGASLHVVAPDVHPDLAAIATTVETRPFEAGDLESAWLALAAAPPAVNRAVKAAADARHTFVIAVDDVASCSAFGAAQVRRGPLTVAISSDGRAPALVALLRRAIEALLVDDVTEWATLAETARRRWKSTAVPMTRRAPLLLAALNQLYADTPASNRP